MPLLKLYLLGSPHLGLDEEAVSIGRKKALALLCYLAIKGEPQRRDALAALLWPETGQSQARAALSRHLTELRKLIGGRRVTADRETVGLTSDLWLDITHFQRDIADLDPADPAATVALTQAVDLYRGDFMSGFTLPDCPDFDEWQFFQREELRQQFATALSHLIAIHCTRKDCAAALPHARRLLALDPLNEAAHRQVMELYARTGQQSAALRQYQLCVEVMDEEFGASPAAETTALYARIRGGEFSREFEQPVSAAIPTKRHEKKRYNLPSQSTPFVGRVVEVAAVTKLLMDTAGRLVTIVGPGGMGKTRLALAAAAAQVESGHFPQGIFFVSLAPLSESAHIALAIADALGFRLEAEGQRHESTKVQLLNHLRAQQLLLVLDNFEYLLSGVDLVTELLRAAPGVHILATSRERLHLHGEQIFPIQGLSLPNGGTPGDAATYTAAQLFIQSARRIRPDFELTASDSAHLLRICRLVEGMPLGIELAAGWVDLLSLAEIATEIQRSLDILETEARDVPDRHRSIRAVFDSSWERLCVAEQQIFSSFAVFRGGFTRLAAENVAGASLRLLSRLVSQSLLHYEQTTGRYQIHELLRQYAAEKLEQADRAEQTSAAHAAYFAAFLRQQEAALRGHAHRQAKAAIAAEFENIRQGWLWAVEHRAFATLDRTGEALYWFLHQDLPRYESGQALFQRGREALAPADDESPHPVWGQMLARVLPYGSGEFEKPVQVKASFEQALHIAQSHDDAAEMAFCRWQLGQVTMLLGDLDAAQRAFERSLAYYQRVNDPFYVAWTLKMLGKVHNRLRKPRQAVDYYRQSLRLHRELEMAEFHLLVDLGLALANGLGEFAEAEHHLCSAYQLSERNENTHEMAGALVYLSRVLAAKGDWTAAQQAATEALAIAQTHGLVYRQLQARMDLGMRAYERAAYAEALAYLRQIQDQSTTYGNQMRIEIVTGLTRFHLLPPAENWSYLAGRLHGPVNLRHCNLPLAALLFQQAGDLERAASLLALFATFFGEHPSGLLGRQIAAEIQAIKEALTAALPEERFAAAWAQGEALEPATTLSGLAEELTRAP
ncbi:MAG: BTAD domain-containing putative transcriptional regulator [Caldilineaceae bacterium]